MAKEKLKSLTLTKQKLVDIEGEHRVTFVASTSTEDRDYEHVAIETFRLPLKGGGHIVVSELPEEGANNIDVPFLSDHNMWEVDKVLGSVRRAWFMDGSLIFECGFSSRAYAQDKYTLLAEGHLDNAFSIQYRDYDHDASNDTDYNGEIVEVSLVTRGSNMDAQVLAVKAMKGKTVEEEKLTTVEAEAEKVEETTPVEAEETKAEEELVEEAEKESETETPAEEEAKEEEKAEETEAESEPEAETEAEETNTNEDKEKSMSHQTEVAKGLVKEPVQIKTVESDYLKSKAAEKDFAKTLYDNARTGNAIKIWKDNLAAKGITGDAILPSRIEQIFFETWEDHGGILSTFRRANARHFAANAFYGEGENIRAKGHKKGQEKAEQTIANERRDLSVKVIYKMLNLDWQDILDDVDGELLAFRTRELASRLADEIALGAILGDGRTAPVGDAADYRVFDGTRGLFSIVADLDGSSTSNSYASMVAQTLANVATDTIYEKIVKTANKVKTNGLNGGRVIIVPEGTIADLQLIKNDNGGFLFQPGTDFNTLFKAKIFELPGVEASGYDVIAYADQGYVLTGTDDVVRTGYDILHNKDQMLVERAVAGSLTGFHTAAGYVSGDSE